MSLLLNPFGFDPIWHPSGQIRSNAYIGGIASGYAANIFKGQPVILSGGFIQALTSGTTDFLGVFAGVEWTDLNTNKPMESDYWPSGATALAGTIRAYVWDDAEILFRVQADGSVAGPNPGQQFNTTNIGNGSTATGLSACTIGHTTVGTGVQGQWACRYLYTDIDQTTNGWGDPFTVLTVQMARNYFVANKVSL